MSNELVNKSINNPIFILTESDLNNLKRDQLITIKCKQCGIEETYKFRKCRLEIYKMFLCINCRKKKTTQEHYGVDNPAQSIIIKDKMKYTCMERYGVEYSGASEIHKRKLSETFSKKSKEEIQAISNKCKQTKLAHFGNENYNNQEKMRQTNLSLYGTEIASQSQIVKDKTKNYFINKYGCINPGQDETVKNKIKATFQMKYGADYWIATDEGRAKISKAIIDKYGTELVKVAKYEFNGILFDSSWELCFYIYNKDNGADIERVKEPFLFEFNGTQHRYYPDFKVENVIYEIKGTQFWKEDGTMQNPYNHSLDDLYEAKHQCGIKNNVVFITNKEIQPFISYVINTYGKEFIKGCIRTIT